MSSHIAIVRTTSSTHPVPRFLGHTIWYVVASLVSVFFVGPFVWTVLSSLKEAQEITTFPPTFLPASPRWANYVYAWNKVPFGNFFINSLTVTGLAIVGQVCSATLVAYGFARFRFPARNAMFLLVLATIMIPWEVTIIPSFLLFKTIGWLDTLNPLIWPHWLGGGAFNIFLMRQFIMTIPRDFDEAAKIDGANSLRTLIYVLVPLCRPAVTTVAIFAFLSHWNDFIGPLIYLNTPERFTVSLGLRYFQTIPMEAGEPKEHLLMAGAVMMAAPCAILFFLAQRYFVKGIVMSGIKG